MPMKKFQHIRVIHTTMPMKKLQHIRDIPVIAFRDTLENLRPVVTIKVFHQKLCQRKHGQSVCCHYQSFFYHLCQRIGGKSCKHENMAPTLTMKTLLSLYVEWALQSLKRDSGTVQGWEGGQLDPGCWEGNKEAHTIHFLKNCQLKTRTSSEIILEWTKQQFNQFFYAFICPY